jgi:cell division protein FtsA
VNKCGVARRNIHVLPQEFKIDGQSEIKEPIGMYGGRLNLVFTCVVGQASSRNVDVYPKFRN